MKQKNISLNDTPSTCFTLKDIDSYKVRLIEEMKKMGADENDLALVHDSTICNSLRKKRKPEDVAWALLQ